MNVNTGQANFTWPLFTLAVVLVSAGLMLWPPGADLLVYNREKILAGQAWRLLSNVLVHFSWQHWFYNALLFAVAAGWLEQQSRGTCAGLLLLSALLNSLYLLIFRPELIYFAGLSGVVSAVVVYLALFKLKTTRHHRSMWMLILLFFVVKVSYEMITQQAVFVSYAGMPVRVMPAAHLVGALVAVLMMLRLQYKLARNEQRPQH